MTRKELYDKQYKELDSYYLLEAAIKDCDDRLSEIETGMYRSPRFDGVASAPSHRNRVEDAYIDNIEKYGKIRAQRAEYRRQKARVELYIDSIDDLLTRMIFEKRFYDRKDWGTIADELGGRNTFDSVRFMCSRYIKKHLDE